MSKRITPRQLKGLYWPAWNAAVKTLVATGTYSKPEAEQFRKDIHTQVCGSEVSSKDLTNRQLDQILAVFTSISRPNDGKAQADQADQPLKRIRYVIKQIQSLLNLPDSYIQGISQKMHRRTLELCDEPQLKSILQALKIHQNRHEKSLERKG